MKLTHAGIRAVRSLVSRGPRRTLASLMSHIVNGIKEKTRIYCCETHRLKSCDTVLPAGHTLVRIGERSAIAAGDLQLMQDHLSKNICDDVLDRRFAQGAQLWLMKVSDACVGYRWSTRGCALGSSYFFPLGDRDAILNDVVVFADYRGRGYDGLFREETLRILAAEGVERIFCQVKDWNTPSIRSVAKSDFVCIGTAKKFRLFNKTFVVWYEATGS